MTIIPGLKAVVAALSAVTTAGAAVAVDRVSQGSGVPSIVIRRSGFDMNETLDGDNDSLITESVVIECRGATSLQSDTLALAVLAMARDLTGAVGSRVCQSVHDFNLVDTVDVDELGVATGRPVTAVAFTVNHKPGS